MVKKRKFIEKAIKEPGALHKELGVPEGEKIGGTRLRKAEAPLEGKVKSGEKLTSSERKEKRRIDLAQTLSKLRRKKSRS